MLTDEDIEQELADHAKRIKKAEDGSWFFRPISLDERAFELRMQQLSERVTAYRDEQLAALRNRREQANAQTA